METLIYNEQSNQFNSILNENIGTEEIGRKLLKLMVSGYNPTLEEQVNAFKKMSGEYLYEKDYKYSAPAFETLIKNKLSTYANSTGNSILKELQPQGDIQELHINGMYQALSGYGVSFVQEKYFNDMQINLIPRENQYGGRFFLFLSRGNDKQEEPAKAHLYNMMSVIVEKLTKEEKLNNRLMDDLYLRDNDTDLNNSMVFKAGMKLTRFFTKIATEYFSLNSEREFKEHVINKIYEPSVLKKKVYLSLSPFSFILGGIIGSSCLSPEGCNEHGSFLTMADYAVGVLYSEDFKTRAWMAVDEDAKVFGIAKTYGKQADEIYNVAYSYFKSLGYAFVELRYFFRFSEGLHYIDSSTSDILEHLTEGIESDVIENISFTLERFPNQMLFEHNNQERLERQTEDYSGDFDMSNDFGFFVGYSEYNGENCVSIERFISLIEYNSNNSEEYCDLSEEYYEEDDMMYNSNHERSHHYRFGTRLSGQDLSSEFPDDESFEDAMLMITVPYNERLAVIMQHNEVSFKDGQPIQFKIKADQLFESRFETAYGPTYADLAFALRNESRYDLALLVINDRYVSTSLSYSLISEEKEEEEVETDV